ncbi:RICIN domain-containing protein [Streptomyces sp. HNM0663]|uniref:RICIN domain-containing protein n=1 Tax=Streptomyces chengmaiensis TaxID=3040919 RepID=A0ABT6I0A7_9ACTN|nr:ricin-type beta-trefoil lectin domain protein [Streptomyces chengmaiensis]MDH2393574.1 RICIN domain-containing protein [Streptomyces chengmaiensis]
MLSRVLVAGLVIVLLSAGVFGIGKLIDYQRDRDQARRDKAAERVVAENHLFPSPSKTPPGGNEQQRGRPPSIPGGGDGPARSAPPPYTLPKGPTPFASASAGSDDKGSTGPASGGGTQSGANDSQAEQDAQRQQSSGSQQSVSGGDDSSDPGGSTHRIVGEVSDKCIDVTDHISSAPNKTVLQIYTCGNNPNQQWTFHSDGTIRALAMCMSVLEGSTADGAAIDVYECNGSASQQWRFTTAGDLVNVKADKCVDVRDLSSADGARLQLWTCAGTGNQKWRLA